MKFDLEEIPFSRYGSYLAFSHPQDGTAVYENQIALRVLYGAFTDQETYPILLCKQDEAGYGVWEEAVEVTADEAELTVRSGKDGYEICFVDDETFLLHSNVPVLITRTKHGSYDRIIRHMDGTLEIAGDGPSLRIWCRTGTAVEKSEGDENGYGCEQAAVLLMPAGTELEYEEAEKRSGEAPRSMAGEPCRQSESGLLVQISLSGLSFKPKEAADYEFCVSRTREEFRRFYQEVRRSVGAIASRFEDGVEEAAYILWHSVVHPEGYVSHPVMLMTKNWMNLVWSWDYTFNALAMAAARPELAYGQYLAMAAMQDSEGAYPDAFQARVDIRSFVKPPIQGFMLKRMFAVHDPGRETKERIYRSVEAFTEWWFAYRAEGTKLPYYCHGNDSGWDNATIFRMGFPVQSPDLAAWLVLQMEFLEETAEELGFTDESARWKNRGEALFRDMMEYFVRNDRFEAVKLPEGEIIPSESLILYLPLILGDRLPETLRVRMLDELFRENGVASEWGLASEPLDSSMFEEDGYWRGAIWPPTTLIMAEALRRCHRNDEALKFAEKFCDMCVEHGFYENYSALDGHGLRDHGFTWTASVFLILLRDFKV